MAFEPKHLGRFLEGFQQAGGFDAITNYIKEKQYQSSVQQLAEALRTLKGNIEGIDQGNSFLQQEEGPLSPEKPVAEEKPDKDKNLPVMDLFSGDNKASSPSGALNSSPLGTLTSKNAGGAKATRPQEKENRMRSFMADFETTLLNSKLSAQDIQIAKEIASQIFQSHKPEEPKIVEMDPNRTYKKINQYGEDVGTLQDSRTSGVPKFTGEGQINPLTGTIWKIDERTGRPADTGLIPSPGRRVIKVDGDYEYLGTPSVTDYNFKHGNQTFRLEGIRNLKSGQTHVTVNAPKSEKWTQFGIEYYKSMDDEELSNMKGEIQTKRKMLNDPTTVNPEARLTLENEISQLEQQVMERENTYKARFHKTGLARMSANALSWYKQNIIKGWGRENMSHTDYLDELIEAAQDPKSGLTADDIQDLRDWDAYRDEVIGPIDPEPAKGKSIKELRMQGLLK